MSIVGAIGTALITGASGQDGYYLSELLQHNYFEVHGVRRPARQNDGAPPPQVRLHTAAFSAAGFGDWQAHVVTDAEFLRPSGRAAMAGDAAKAGAVLGWYPTLGFDEIVKAMVSSDLEQEQHTCL